ncbi:jg14868 [Pararge aegeria aegeria]|uniref:Jg14868 protein n=1 Tax=Pararge aegeria aegeria TaxID=348720 RepID=A0A8S4R129_9NEOP|nr:jg14868 [Pararge aegeria aegeria]
MGNYKLPTIQQFLNKKKIYDPKEPVWVYLEREMRENIEKKPYNEKVGDWLRFLKDLKYYYFCEQKRKLKRLNREVGPPWYYELSSIQREVLSDLKANIHQDLLEDLPTRIRKSLSDLGVTLRISKKILMDAMNESVEDPGVFIWNLYTAYYNKPPSELRAEYDMNSMILMSCLVFVDLSECIAELENLTHTSRPPSSVHEKKHRKNTQPNTRYGEYLQKCYIPCYSNHSKKKQPEKPLPLGYKVKLRSTESYERLCKDLAFLAKRKERNKKELQVERVCNYKFWEPPSTLRVAVLSTGYIPINGGVALPNGEAVTTTIGYWKFPRDVQEICDATCDCLAKWESTVMEFLKQSRCKCGHLYDLYNEGKPKEKYFYPPNRHGPFWIDNAKIFQLDPLEDFVKDTVKECLMSTEPTAFLAELSDTPLLIPHLPKANLLANLQEWVRKRIKGKLTPEDTKKLLYQSHRRWLDLKHVDFRSRAYRIPFTLKQLKHINWSHRHMGQKLFEILLNDFVSRNSINQVRQTRLWWPTTKYDSYRNPESFLNVFFTYMPGRMKDTFLINPYSSELTPKHGAKTCPL